MRDILITLLVFGSLPLILKRPYVGILVWTWLGFMNPHRLAWGFSVDMPFAMIVAITTLISLLISRESKQIPWKRETVLMVIFLLWMLLTTSLSFYPQLAWDQMNKVAKIFLMIFVGMILTNSRERLIQLVWVIALSIGFFGVKGGIFTILTGGVYRVRGPEGSFIEGNNEIGLALTMTAPLLYYLSLQTKRGAIRITLLASMVLTSLAAIGTQSRGAALGMAGMVVLFWLKSRQKLAVTLLLVVFAPILLYLMPAEWYDRMSTISNYQSDASATGRLSAWLFAYNLAMNRIVGGGFECFQEAMFLIYSPGSESVHDSHSIYFGILGHHGFPGLAIFLMLIFCTWLSASAVIRRTKNDPELEWLTNLMAMTQVSLVAYLTAGAFLGMQYFDYFYNLILIIVSAKVILAQHIATKTTAESGGSGAAPTVGAGAVQLPQPVGSTVSLAPPRGLRVKPAR